VHITSVGTEYPESVTIPVVCNRPCYLHRISLSALSCVVTSDLTSSRILVLIPTQFPFRTGPNNLLH